MHWQGETLVLEKYCPQLRSLYPTWHGPGKSGANQTSRQSSWQRGGRSPEDPVETFHQNPACFCHNACNLLLWAKHFFSESLRGPLMWTHWSSVWIHVWLISSESRRQILSSTARQKSFKILKWHWGLGESPRTLVLVPKEVWMERWLCTAWTPISQLLSRRVVQWEALAEDWVDCEVLLLVCRPSLCTALSRTAVITSPVSSSSPQVAWRSAVVGVPQPDSTHQKKRQVCSWKRAHDVSEELHRITNMHICCRHGRERQGPPDEGGAHEGTTEETERTPWPLESHPQSLSAKKEQILEKTFLKGLGISSSSCICPGFQVPLGEPTVVLTHHPKEPASESVFSDSLQPFPVLLLSKCLAVLSP